jgi:hypothetical protein
MATGCERFLTEEWAPMVHALMIELCGRCTCEDSPEVIEALWVERPARALLVSA